MVIGALQVFATGSNAQKVTIQGKNLSLATVLRKITRQTGFEFFYNHQLLKDAKSISIEVKAQPLEAVLDACFAGQPLSYRVIEKTIVIEKGSALLRTYGSTFAAFPITGRIIDEQGNPLSGVTVQEKGTSNATTTDEDGNFSFTLVSSNSVLILKYVGYLTQEVSVKERGDLSIMLLPNPVILDSVVVVGYGTQKKLNLTGSVSTITAKELNGRPITSVGSALQGQLPGVTVVNSTAIPGNNGGTIRIRGIGTLNDASPLIVIDGVPSGNIDILNPSDIENITVLKDAASSSIYGVRGANGVVLITTKTGKSNTKPTFAYQGYWGAQKPTALPEFVGSVDYMQLRNEANVNAGTNPTYTDAQIEIARNGSDPDNYANTNWINEIYKSNAPQWSQALSLSGGANNTTYYASYSYLKEGGLLIGDKYHASRHNARLRVTSTVLDRLKIDANLGYIDRDYSGSSLGIGANSGPMYLAHQISPLVPVKFSSGTWGYGGGAGNPVAMLNDAGYNDFGSQEFTGNLQATLNITNSFRLRGQFGLVRSNGLRSVFEKTISYYRPDGSLMATANNPNKFTNTDYTSTYKTFLGMAEYEKTFSGVHYLKAMGAVSQEETVSKGFSASRTNFPSEDVGNLSLGTANQLNSGNASQNALRSVFGRINYAYDDRYLAEADIRYDGSSRFASDKRWHTFLSGSLGWVFSNEQFFDPWRKIIEIGKIRLSYGSQGNDKVGSDYAYQSTIGSVSTEPIGNALTVGYAPSGLPNTILTWESEYKKDLGLDLTMLQGKLGLSADYYINETKNILLNVPLPDVIGVSSYPAQNAGKVQNKGWEIQVSWNDKAGDFNYGISANMSDVRNKVTSLGNVAPTVGDNVRMVGYPIDAYYGFVSEGLAQVSDFTYDAATNKYTPDFPYDNSYPMQPGDVKYKDLNGDGKITSADDRKVIGSAIPRYTYGVRGNIGYKGIDLSFFLQGVGKGDGYIWGSSNQAFINSYSNPQKIHLDRWTPENTDASYPRLVYGQGYNQRLSTYWLQDASYLRMKNIQLGYTIPQSYTKKYRISSWRIYLSVDNLFTITDFFKSYDPESPSTAGGYYPQVKTFVFGLNINFQ